MDLKKFRNETYAYHLRSALARTLAENTKLEKEVEQLKDDLAELESDYDCLENERDTMEGDRDEYYDNWKMTEIKLEDCQEIMSNLDMDISDYLDHIDDLQEEVRQLKRKLNENSK